MLFQPTSRVLLALLPAAFLSPSSRAASLERLSAAAPRNVSVSYDPIYDNGTTLFTQTSCSFWMAQKGYLTLSTLPSFSSVGGADVIDGSRSTLCGQCWQLTSYTPTETNVHVLLIDGTKHGFAISEHAMNVLTGGQAKKLGRVDAVGSPVARSHCGMP